VCYTLHGSSAENTTRTEMKKYMSYAVVRMQKMKSHDLKGIQFHNQRERKSRTNEDIDEERTKENYDLVNDENIDYNERVHEIIESQKISTRKTRKDAVLVNELLVTSDKKFFDGLDPDEQRKFFEESYKLFSERYGKQNIAYATVHMDEKTPHMHLGVVPMRDGRLQGRNVFNRQELLWIQNEFPKHMQENDFKLKRGEHGSTRKHLETHEFKKQTLEKQYQNTKEKYQKELSAEHKKLKEIKTSVSNVYDTKLKLNELDNQMKRTITGRRVVKPEDLNKLKSFVVGVQKSAAKSVVESQRLEITNENLSDKLDKVTKERNRAVQRRKELITELDDLKAENRQLRDDLSVSDSKMKDLGYDRSKMSQIEYKGHLVMNRLDRGIKPKNKDTAKNWHDILDENKKRNLINNERIKKHIEQLKQAIQKFVNLTKGLFR